MCTRMAHSLLGPGLGRMENLYHQTANPSASHWGLTVLTDCMIYDWIGAPHPTNTTGEISALYRALQWVQDVYGPSSPVVRRCVNLITTASIAYDSLGTTPSSLDATSLSFS